MDRHFSDKPLTIAIAGATGGIGNAFCQLCQQNDNIKTIYALSRNEISGSKITHYHLDYDDPNCLTALKDIPHIDILVIATGTLANDNSGPEKRIEQINLEALHQMHHINAFGPMLLIQSLHHALNKDSSACITLSAKVGSIQDNNLGGWYAYRASKASLNMLMRSYSIEVSRSKKCIVSMYHPGTVATKGFMPYQQHADPATIKQPNEVAEELWEHILSLAPEHNGQLIDDKGETIPF